MEDAKSTTAATEAEADHEWTVQHRLFPALRQLRPPASMARDNSVIEIADLTALYRIFERC